MGYYVAFAKGTAPAFLPQTDEVRPVAGMGPLTFSIHEIISVCRAANRCGADKISPKKEAPFGASEASGKLF